MANEILEKFGKFFIENSFNNGMWKLDNLISGELKAYKKLQNEIKSLNKKQIETLKKCVVVALNATLHDLLFAFQEAHDLEKGIEITIDEKNIAELSDGLNGELYSDEGWFAKYSSYKGDPSEIE